MPKDYEGSFGQQRASGTSKQAQLAAYDAEDTLMRRYVGALRNVRIGAAGKGMSQRRVEAGYKHRAGISEEKKKEHQELQAKLLEQEGVISDLQGQLDELKEPSGGSTPPAEIDEDFFANA